MLARRSGLKIWISSVMIDLGLNFYLLEMCEQIFSRRVFCFTKTVYKG